MNKIELSIRKKTSTANAAENVAGPAVDTALVTDGTDALERKVALFDNKNVKIGIFTKVVSGKESGRTSSDYNNIVIRFCSWFLPLIHRLDNRI